MVLSFSGSLAGSSDMSFLELSFSMLFCHEDIGRNEMEREKKFNIKERTECHVSQCPMLRCTSLTVHHSGASRLIEFIFCLCEFGSIMTSVVSYAYR